MTRLKKLFNIARDPFWIRALLLHGVGASAENRAALAGLTCNTVIDIGANRGQFSLLARKIFPDANIVAFEPLAGPAAVYRRVFARDLNVILHECAIGELPGKAQMHVSARDDSSSLLPIEEAQLTIFPRTVSIGQATVEVSTLARALSADDIQSPALLKLDVQGFELNALRGCESLLSKFAYIYCECSFITLYGGQALADEVIAWLRTHGFILCGAYNLTHDRDGKAVQADLMFTKSEDHCQQ